MEELKKIAQNNQNRFLSDEYFGNFLEPSTHNAVFHINESFPFLVKLLIKLGFENTYKGFYYLIDCIVNYKEMQIIAKVYKTVAEKHSLPVESIIKRIEVCIKANKNAQILINNLMGGPVCSPYLTNAEVISILFKYYEHKFLDFTK